MYVVQVWNGKRWAKVRGAEGGPWSTKDRAERIAFHREHCTAGVIRPHTTEGRPHRVVAV